MKIQTGFLLTINYKNRNNVSIPLDTKQYSVGSTCLLRNKNFSGKLLIPFKYLLSKFVKVLIFITSHKYAYYSPQYESVLSKSGVVLISFIFFFTVTVWQNTHLLKFWLCTIGSHAVDPSFMQAECLLMWIVQFGTVPGKIIFTHHC